MHLYREYTIAKYCSTIAVIVICVDPYYYVIL